MITQKTKLLQEAVELLFNEVFCEVKQIGSEQPDWDRRAVLLAETVGKIDILLTEAQKICTTDELNMTMKVLTMTINLCYTDLDRFADSDGSLDVRHVIRQLNHKNELMAIARENLQFECCGDEAAWLRTFDMLRHEELTLEIVLNDSYRGTIPHVMERIRSRMLHRSYIFGAYWAHPPAAMADSRIGQQKSAFGVIAESTGILAFEFENGGAVMDPADVKLMNFDLKLIVEHTLNSHFSGEQGMAYVEGLSQVLKLKHTKTLRRKGKGKCYSNTYLYAVLHEIIEYYDYNRLIKSRIVAYAAKILGKEFSDVNKRISAKPADYEIRKRIFLNRNR